MSKIITSNLSYEDIKEDIKDILESVEKKNTDVNITIDNLMNYLKAKPIKVVYSLDNEA